MAMDPGRMPAAVRPLYLKALQFFQAKDYAAALAMLPEICAVDPNCFRVRLLEAYLYRDNGQPLAELQALRELLAGDWEVGSSEAAGLYADAWSLLGAAWNFIGQSESAVAAFQRAAEWEPDSKQKAVEYSNAVFAANNLELPPEGWQQLFTGYQELFKTVRPYRDYPWKHAVPRIGYLSADFYHHPVAAFFLPLLRYGNRQEYQVYCYAANTREDEVTAELRSLAAVWRDISRLSAEQAAAAVHADEIDILVDLGGHTAGNCLPVLAWHPARLQLSGLGYMGSTGLRETEYFLSDCCCDSADDSPYFTERLLRLPHSHFCYEPLQSMPAVQENPPCRKDGRVTFGCFNNFAKVTDEMLQLWSEILGRVPGSQLLLKHKLFSSAEGRSYTQRRLEKAYIDLERVQLQGFSTDYLTMYKNIDLALDTYPYTGGLTTCEALYMGVPVISRYGARHGSRFGYSLLMNLGLGELAAPDAQSYVERAVAVAGDVQLLTMLRQQLRGMMRRSPLMDGPGYAREVESLYRQIWGEHICE